MFPVHHWLKTVCAGNPAAVVALYAPDGILIGTVAQKIKCGRRAIRGYFDMFLKKPNLCGVIHETIYQHPAPGVCIASGTYTFSWGRKQFWSGNPPGKKDERQSSLLFRLSLGWTAVVDRQPSLLCYP